MTNTEKISRVFVRWCLLAALIAASFGYIRSAEAASVHGNTTEDSPTSHALTVQGGSSSGIPAGTLEHFSVGSNFTSSTLTVYVGKQGTPTDELRVQLCIPNGLYQNQDDPCASPVVSYLNTTIEPSDLPSWNATPGATAPTIIDMGESIEFEPGIGYVLAFSRTGAYNGNDFYRTLINTGIFGSGQVLNNLGGCSDPDWVPTESTASGCTNDELDTKDLLFSLTSYGDGDLTIEATAAGSKVHVIGQCVEPDDLPNGWLLYSNTVSVKYTDGSATGTWILGQYDCVDGVYNSPVGGVPLWNGEFTLLAEQPGNPKTFQASTTITMDGSSVVNPTAGIIQECPRDESWIQCYAYNFVKNILTIRPFSWFAQIMGALTAEPGGAWRSTEGAATVPTDWSALTHLGTQDALKVNGQTILDLNLDPTASGSTTWTVARSIFNWRGYLVWCVYLEYLFFAAWMINRIRNRLT